MVAYPSEIETPEQRLVFCCARRTLALAISQEVNELARRNLDWKAVFRFAEEQNLVPLLHKHLLSLSESSLPAEIQEKLNHFAAIHTKRNLQFVSELLRLSRLMEKQGVTLLTYKGPALAHSAYGNLRLRSCNDLDVLVHPRDIKVASEVLLQNGYSPKLDQENEVTSLRKNQLRVAEYHHPFVNEEEHILIELHWAIVPSQFSFDLELDTDTIWARRVPSELNASVATFSPEDMVLALCIHGAKHGWALLEWIASLSALLFEKEYNQFNWAYLIAHAQKTQTHRMLWAGMALAKEVAMAPWPASMPSSLKNAIEADNVTSTLQTQVWRYIFKAKAATEPTGVSEQEEQRHRFLWTGLQGWNQRRRYALGYLISLYVWWHEETRREFERKNIRGWRARSHYIIRATRSLRKLLLRAF